MMLLSDEEQLCYLMKEAKANQRGHNKSQDLELFTPAYNLIMRSKSLSAQLKVNIRSQTTDYREVLLTTLQQYSQRLDEYQTDQQDIADWIQQIFGECLQDKLFTLIEEAKSHSNRMHRTPILVRIHCLVTDSNKLWRGGRHYQGCRYYNDALHDMWAHCFDNLDEYDPNECRVITWMNNVLRKKLDQDRYRDKRDNHWRAKPVRDKENDWRDPLDSLPSKSEPKAYQVHQRLVEWVKQDRDHVLRHIRCPQNPAITAQDVVLTRLLFGKDIQEAALYLGLSENDNVLLSRWWHNIYPRIKKILQAWALENGHLEWDEAKQRYCLDIE